MLFISHRGNLKGIKKNLENHPRYLLRALECGFNVEVDVWLHKKKIYLGHDKPKYLLTNKLLKFKKKIWFHAKNIEVLPLLKKKKLIYFWHQKDDVTITSNGYWWTFPGKKILKNSICVLPKKIKKGLVCAGICSDNIMKVKKKFYD